MKRTSDDIKIPDIINKSTSKNFTRIPNELLRNKNLSYKAKGLISLLLSNKDGWHSYLSVLESMGNDGISAVKTGLQELEKEGYLLRIRYRDKEKKRVRGSFWIYTDKPGQFEGLEETHRILNEAGMIADWPENLEVENLLEGFQQVGNNSLKRTINKKTKNKKTNSLRENGKSSNFSKNKPSQKKNKPSAKERTKKYIPLAKHLAETVQSHIDYDIDLSRIKKWARSLRLLHEQNGVHPKRQKKVLSWYRKNIGGDFIPEAFSGSSFREKFPKLESAIKRQKNPPKNNKPKPPTAHKDDYPFQQSEKEY